MRLSWPLTGRSEELRRIHAALTSPAVTGVVVSGAEGVGKSRLADEVRSTLATRGFVDRFVAATSSARAVPLGAFAEWVPSGATATVDLVRGVVASLTSAPPGSRVLVVVDDAHLLDDLSIFVVHQLVQRRAADVLLTVLDSEPIPVGLQEVCKLGGFDRLRIQPLGLGDTAELVSAALNGAVAAETTRRLWELTRGNPLYLRTIVEQEIDDGRIEQLHGHWRWIGEPGLPAGLIELIEGRLGALPEELTDVLDVLAVYEPIPLPALNRLAGPAAVEDADTRGLVTVSHTATGLEVRVAHPVYGEVRRRRAPATKLRRLRGLVADGLATSADADAVPLVVRRAALLIDSDLPPDPHLLTRAAHGAVALADLALAARLARAAMHSGAGPEAHFVCSHALSWLGEGTAADEVLAALDTARLTDAQRARLAFLRASNALWALADPTRAKALIDAAADTVPPQQHNYIDAFNTVYWFAVDRPDAVPHWETTTFDELPAIVGAETAWAMTTVHADAGRTSAAVHAAAAGRRAVTRSSEAPHMAFNIEDSHVSALWRAGEIDAIDEVTDRVRRQAADLPGSGQALGAAIAGRAALARGDLGQACALLNDAADELCETHPLGWGFRYSLPRATGLAMRGDVDAAATVLATLTGLARPFRSLDDELSVARAWVAAGRGTVSTAVAILLAAAERARAVGRFAVEVMCLQTATQFGNDTCAPRLAELTSIVEGPRAALAADFAFALGNGDAAQLAALAMRFEQMGDLVAALDASAHAAVNYRKQDRRGSALACAARAEELARRCGGARTPALDLASAPVPLTDREREIVTLIGRGMSNRAIAEQLTLSVRTVESHIYRAMARCGAASRDELAALLRPGV
ncbi:helix-turn-helix transcriptional regulator [Mycolicibacterium duvalii]|uniref:Transcriptional regulator n=1 Tax=Mycolicibacterium duvalii TaxID=39688 RepID=A0A7I7JXN6_9MYCO|nr:LuxR family transcriptional regulator [Mycolicibacterium duvalii]MCV7367004.1 helix-turn-helix transcriptional regulator [Mycolicibacterium duvalii]PEG40309.1 helix-turn-helix transcriptional regulator [Mycolicibacterium duvalii]BBX15872.1 transcriptional regulator [Mycolicibacterium duvalii]